MGLRSALRSVRRGVFARVSPPQVFERNSPVGDFRSAARLACSPKIAHKPAGIPYPPRWGHQARPPAGALLSDSVATINGLDPPDAASVLCAFRHTAPGRGPNVPYVKSYR